MPNLQTSIKDLRQNKRKVVYNNRLRSRIKRAVKKFDTLIEKGEKKEAAKMLPQVYKVLDKAAKKGVIKKGNASRRISRFNKKLNNLTAKKNVKTAKKSA